MIGNFSKNKCRIFDTSETTEINKYQIRLIYELIHIHGMSCGAGLYSEYICDKDVDIGKGTNELQEFLNEGFKEDIKKVIKGMQEALNIGDKLFIYDVSKNIINIFDISYDEFLDKRGFVSEDFTKVVLPI